MKIRIVLLMILILILCIVFVSCNLTELPSDNTKLNNAQHILTEVYTKSLLYNSEVNSVQTSVVPFYDTSNEIIKFLSESTEEVVGEDESVRYKYIYKLMSLNPHYGIIDENLIDIGDRSNIICGQIIDSAFIGISHTYDSESGNRNYKIINFNLTSHKLTVSDSINQLFKTYTRDDFYIRDCNVDSDGQIYIGTDTSKLSEIIVINQKFELLSNIYVSGWISDMSSDENGDVYVVSDSLYRIDKKTYELINVASLGSIDKDIKKVYFGKEHDFFYSNKNGIYCVDYLENNQTYNSEMLMNYINSSAISSRIVPMLIIDKGTFIFAEISEFNKGIYNLVRYTPSDDLYLSDKNAIVIAYASDIDFTKINEFAISYSRSHYDTNVVLLDYTKYNTRESPDGGVQRLALDLITGVIKPDIVIGSSGNTDINQIIKKELFIDLNQYLEQDELINYDNLFGCVKNTMTTIDNKMWGITDQIYVNTLVSTTNMLGRYADKNKWEINEFLDYAESLPEDIIVMNGLCQESYTDFLMNADGFGSFVDEVDGICSFDSDDFIRLIKYISLQPKTWDELWAKSLLYKFGDTKYYEYYHNNMVSLFNLSIGSIADLSKAEITFGTKDIVPIGYPTNKESGVVIKSRDIFIITTYSKNPDLAWEFIHYYFEKNQNPMMVPTLKSRYNSVIEEVKKCTFVYYFNRSMFEILYDEDAPASLTEPGIIVKLNDEDYDKYYELLDNAGARYRTDIDDEIVKIINEELSYLSSGRYTAEECANVIQSRVSIWLSEHQ